MALIDCILFVANGLAKGRKGQKRQYLVIAKGAESDGLCIP